MVLKVQSLIKKMPYAVIHTNIQNSKIPKDFLVRIYEYMVEHMNADPKVGLKSKSIILQWLRQIVNQQITDAGNVLSQTAG